MGSRRRTIRAAFIGYIYGRSTTAVPQFSAHNRHLQYASISTPSRINVHALSQAACTRPNGTLYCQRQTQPPCPSVRSSWRGKSSRECHVPPPPDDLTRSLLLEEVRPRLQHRAFRAWSHTCEEAAATSRPPPKPPDECTVLPHRPRLHRFGLLLAAEAGVGDLPMEPMVLHQCQHPWTEYSCCPIISRWSCRWRLTSRTHPRYAETRPRSH